MVLSRKIPSSISSILAAVLIIVALLAIYYPASHFDFINFDDPGYITNNPMVVGGLNKQSIIWAFSTFQEGHWHPLTWISHMLDVQLFGINPGAFHSENILWHICNTLLVFFLICRVRPSNTTAALFIALAFGLHPLRLESVVWLSERKDVLGMFFGLLAIHCFVSFRKKASWWSYLSMLAAFACGLLSKPTVITLPVLLLIFDYWFTDTLDKDRLKVYAKKILITVSPLFVISFAFALLSINAQHNAGGLRTLSTTPLDTRLAGAFLGYLIYFGKTIIPDQIAIFYPFVKHAPGVAAGAFLGFAALTLTMLRSGSRDLACGWLWFVISLMPMIGFIQIGGQSYADRWTYLPHVGLLTGLILWLESKLTKHSLQKVFIPLMLLVVCGFAWKTSIELPYWKNSITLFSRNLEVTPDNFMAHTNLGTALDNDGRLDEAAIHFEEAVRLNPTYPEALNNLGSLRARQGRLSEAFQNFDKALLIRPNFPLVQYNLGFTHTKIGNHLTGVLLYTQVLMEDPGMNLARQSLEYELQNFFNAGCASIRSINSIRERESYEQLRRLPIDPTRLYLSPAAQQILMQILNCQ